MEPPPRLRPTFGRVDSAQYRKQALLQSADAARAALRTPSPPPKVSPETQSLPLWASAHQLGVGSLPPPNIAQFVLRHPSAEIDFFPGWEDPTIPPFPIAYPANPFPEDEETIGVELVEDVGLEPTPLASVQTPFGVLSRAPLPAAHRPPADRERASPPASPLLPALRPGRSSSSPGLFSSSQGLSTPRLGPIRSPYFPGPDDCNASSDNFDGCHEAKALRARLDNNFYVSCALSAVMTYAENELNVSFQRSSIQICYVEPAGAMGLDRSTIESLELLQNVRRTANKRVTLLNVLDSTLTPQGRRLLRASLLQPSTDAEIIKGRHDAVEAFMEHEGLFGEIVKQLKGLLRVDLEKLAIWLLNPTPKGREFLEHDVVISGGRHQILLPSHEDLFASESELDKILMLKQYLGRVQSIHATLELAECRSSPCELVRWTCSPESLDIIRAVIDDKIEKIVVYGKSPIDIRNNWIWAVRAEPKSVLERARTSFRYRLNELIGYVDALNEKLGNPAGLYLDNNQKHCLRFHWSDVEREVMRSSNAGKGKTANSSSSVTSPFIRLAGVEVVNGTRTKQYFHCQTVELLQRSAGVQLQADLITTQNDKAVTHFTKLARLLNLSSPSSVINVHLTGHSTQEGDIHKISLPHTLANGPVPNEDYGIDLARRFFPPRIFENAERVTQFLRKMDPNKNTGQMTREFKLNKLQLGLSEVLKQAHSSSMDNETLASFLRKLRIDYNQRLAEIERDVEAEGMIDNEPATKDVPKPVLKKPTPVELRQVRKREQTEEKRVMKSNKGRCEKRIRPQGHKKSAQEKKRKQREWDKYTGYVQK
ncbi:hypothetical protein B0T14DRAFT_560379 [Immersiella caudata]|uniref:DNA mismatch repair protein MutS core domain-containing protein n=1 Tax=Immersiella caudata TaxID=314043 RepID=A0AA39XFL2_9PEZI|nr:hypothetical protein B0T14DRAFT_560379 [Immersiella caudata]